MVKYGCDLFKKVARDTSLDINVRKKSRRLLAILGVNGELHILFALFFLSLYSVLCITCYKFVLIRFFRHTQSKNERRQDINNSMFYHSYIR